MGKINSVYFDPETVAKKPDWFRSWYAAQKGSAPPLATITPPDEPKPAKPTRKRRNKARDTSTHPELESDIGHAPLVPSQGPTVYSSRVRVRFVVYRKRALDPCNECSKWMVDCLRYFRILKDDRLSDMSLEVDQRAAGSKEEERTEIEITPL